MKAHRLPVLAVSTILLAGSALAQSLPALVKSATGIPPVRAKRVITNDDIPPVVEPDPAAAQKPAPAAASLTEASADDEVCMYIGDLLTEEKALEPRIKKLQASLDKADSDQLRNVYNNALKRLTDSLHDKQMAREEALSTPQGGNCSQKPKQAALNVAEKK